MNTVIIGNSVVVINVHVGNFNVLAVGEYHCPAGRVKHLNACNLNVLTVIEEDGLCGTLNNGNNHLLVIFLCCLYILEIVGKECIKVNECIAAKLNLALALKGDIFTVKSIDKRNCLLHFVVVEAAIVVVLHIS